MGPRPKPKPQADERRVLPPEDADGAHEVLDVDGEQYLRWLETGEGEDPCRGSSG
jgi:hypothetical protein